MKLLGCGLRKWVVLLAVAMCTAPLQAGKIKILTRQDYYTTEKKGEILFFLDKSVLQTPFTGDILLGDEMMNSRFPISAGMNRIPLDLSRFEVGETLLRCRVFLDNDSVVTDTLIGVKVLPPKANAVQTDRLTGSLVVQGVPSAAYARVGKDRGATYCVDSRISHSGGHSVRMVTPEDGKGAGLSFFPAYLEYGRTYRFTIWARAAARLVIPEKRSFFYRLFHRKSKVSPARFRLSAGDITQQSFVLTEGWKQYEMFITPQDPATPVQRVSISLYPETLGTAWFDDLSLKPVIEMETSVDNPGRSLQVTFFTPIENTILRYERNGEMPDSLSRKYAGPFPVNEDAALVAGVFREGRRLGIYSQSLVVHKALGRVPEPQYSFSSRYASGGAGALTDGLVGQANYKDHAWQGYYHVDLAATIDLDSLQETDTLEMHFLQQPKVWIYYPREVNYYLSPDGKDYILVYQYRPDTLSAVKNTGILTVRWTGGPVRARYIRVVAKNTGICPEGAPGAGMKAWLFCDEIVVR